MPQPGATVDFRGNPTSFTPNPFMLTMTEGCLLDIKAKPPKCITTAPKAPPKTPARRPGTTGARTGARTPARKPPSQ